MADPEILSDHLAELYKVMDDEALSNALAGLRPRPVMRLHGKHTAAGVQLTWQAHRQRADRLFRVRRPAVPPDVPELPADTRESVFTDAAHLVALPLTYTVEVVRMPDEPSVSAVSAPAQVEVPALTPPVKDARGKPEAEGIRLSWTPPPGSESVEIYRRQVGATEVFSPVVTLHQNQARAGTHFDSAPLPLIPYEYRIVAGYRRGAVTRSSEPVTLFATWEPLPTPVTDLTYTRTDDETIVLIWSPPDRGSVEILVCAPGRAPTPGVHSSTAVEGHARLAGDGQESTPGRLTARFPSTSADRDLVPVSRQGSQIAVGPSTRLLGTLPAPEKVTVRLQPGGIRVSWSWPAGGSRAEVSWSGRAGAAPPRKSITRGAYDVDGCLVPATRDTIEITVQSSATAEPGILRLSRPVSVRLGIRGEARYRASRVWPLGRRRRIRLRTKDLDHLPSARVVVKDRVRPRSADDGHLLAAIPAGPGPVSVVVTLPTRMKDPHLHVFSDDPAVQIRSETTRRWIGW